MKYFEQDYEMLRKQKKENKNNVKKFLESFIESGIYCVKVIDDEKLYYNNNDLNRVLSLTIKRNDFKIKSFLFNGEVYLKRK